MNTEQNAFTRDQASLKRFLVTGTAWSAGGRVLAMLANLALSMVLARALQPSEYGQFYVALSSVVIFAVFAAMGMDQVVVRAAAKSGKKADSKGSLAVINRCLILAAIGASLSAAVAAILGAAFPSAAFGSSAVFGIVLAWAIAGTLQMQMAESYRALGKIKWANVFGGVRSSGMLNAIIPLFAMLAFISVGELSLRTALSIMLVSASVITVVGYSVLALTHRQSAPVADSKAYRWRELAYLGVPLWLASVATVVHTQGFLWVASVVESESGVALLAAAQRTVLVLIAPTAIVNAVLPPIVARLWDDSEGVRLQKTVQVVAAVATLPSTMILIAVACAGPQLLELMFGDYYSGAYAALLILCLAVSFDIATGSWQLVLAMTGNGKKLLHVTLLGFALFLSIVPFSRQYSIAGVAAAWGIATIAMNIIGLIVTHRATNVWCFARLTRTDVLGVSNAVRRWLSSAENRA